MSSSEAESGAIWHVQCWDDRGDGSTFPDPLGTGRVGYAKRVEHYVAHKEYTVVARKTCKVRIIAAGPMVSEDGSIIVGSALVLEGAKDEVEKYLFEDPLHMNGVWADVKLARYIPLGGVEAVPNQK